MIRKLMMLGSFVFLFASVALAQSSIGGVVKDNTGAVLVGAKVVASSPVLIEGSRTATTAGDGRYVIPNILAGDYTVTFTQQGFSTVTQTITVPQNVTVPMDATMQVGSSTQTVQVQAQIATVDVENAAHPNEISRQVIDSVPTARNMQAIGSSVPSVHLSAPDVGGTQQVQQTYMTAHGMAAQSDPVYIDGMLVNAMQGDGMIQQYFDDEAFQDTTYQAGDNPVDAYAGGVEVQMTTKEGGNSFHSDVFLGYVPSSFVGNNLNAGLIARNVTAQGKTVELKDFDGSIGGPIKKDKLWFMISVRDELTKLQSPLGLLSVGGGPAIDQGFIYTGTLHLTYQATPKNKFSAMWMRMWKTALHEVVTNTGNGVAYLPAYSTRRTPVMYYVMQGKWSATVTPRLLVEAGYSRQSEDYNVQDQAGIYQTPFTPAWYAGTLLDDGVTGLRYNSGGIQSYYRFERNALNADGVYVIGAHQIKFGFQDSYGPAWTLNAGNGDGLEVEESGVPTSFTAYDTPAVQHDYLTSDLGIYAEDVWHYKRLAITPGIRWEYLAAEIQPESTPAGRFVPARNVPQITCATIKGMGCYKDWTPRLGLVYDVFGDHKTAIKADVAKYDIPLVDSFLYPHNPEYPTTVSLSWSDPGCTGPSCVAMNNQLSANPNPVFGNVENLTLNPNFHRQYVMQYNLGVQRQILGGLTGNFNYYHTSYYQQSLTINTAVPSTAWTPVTVQNPLNGTPLTVYNLQPAYRGLVPVLQQTNAPRSLRSDTYTGFETSVSGKLPHGANILGGWTIERQLDTDCDNTVNNSLLNDPNSYRFCDWSGKQFQSLGAVPALPFRSEFKLQGSVPIKYGIAFNANLYSDPVYNAFVNNIGSTYSPLATFVGDQDGLQQVNWNLSAGTKYPANCKCTTPGAVVDSGLIQGAETVELVAPGTELDPRLNQLDVGLRRVFKFHEKYTAIAELQTFNILNSSVPTKYGQTLGSTITPFVPGGIGGGVTAFMNPRMFRINGQFKF